MPAVFATLPAELLSLPQVAAAAAVDLPDVRPVQHAPELLDAEAARAPPPLLSLPLGVACIVLDR